MNLQIDLEVPNTKIYRVTYFSPLQKETVGFTKRRLDEALELVRILNNNMYQSVRMYEISVDVSRVEVEATIAPSGG